MRLSFQTDMIRSTYQGLKLEEKRSNQLNGVLIRKKSIKGH